MSFARPNLRRKAADRPFAVAEFRFVDGTRRCVGCLGDRRCWVCLGDGRRLVSRERRVPCHRCDATGVCSLCR
jgi:hypothetical protein